MQCTACTNFLHKKIPYLHALQGNGEMGARYLDPKYSRWISVDPALGEYVPGAGKANTKDAGGLPGMGGLFNSVNLNLFHYAGNNPVRYIDPTGRDIVYQDNDGNEVRREPSERNEIHTPKSDLELLNKNAKIMEEHKWDIFFFAENVQTNGIWDFKNTENTNYRSRYWFNNDLISAENFGNVHYGYVGAAGGFGLSLLIDAPGIAQINQNHSELSFIITNFDDPIDTLNIMRGYYAYDMPLSTLIYDFVAEELYKGPVQAVFKNVAFTFFIGRSIYNFFHGERK